MFTNISSKQERHDSPWYWKKDVGCNKVCKAGVEMGTAKKLSTKKQWTGQNPVSSMMTLWVLCAHAGCQNLENQTTTGSRDAYSRGRRQLVRQTIIKTERSVSAVEIGSRLRSLDDIGNGAEIGELELQFFLGTANDVLPTLTNLKNQALVDDPSKLQIQSTLYYHQVRLEGRYKWQHSTPYRQRGKATTGKHYHPSLSKRQLRQPKVSMQ